MRLGNSIHFFPVGQSAWRFRMAFFFSVLALGPLMASFIPPGLISRCLFKELQEFDCPGCGITRSIQALINLDLASAYHFHPSASLIWFIAIVLAGYFWTVCFFQLDWITWSLEIRLLNYIDRLMVILLIVGYVYKNIQNTQDNGPCIMPKVLEIDYARRLPSLADHRCDLLLPTWSTRPFGG